MPPSRPVLGLVAILLVYFSAGILAITLATPTVDEPNHFTRGVALWQTGDTRLSFAHPPLANAIAALPATLGPALPPVEATEAWSAADPGGVATSIATPAYPRFRRGLMWGRAVQLLWGAALVVCVFGFARRHLGTHAALGAALLLALTPTFVAHNSLVTTDGPIAFAAFLLVTASWEHGRSPDRWTTLRLFAGAALAPIVKHSGPALLVIALLIFAATRLAHAPRRWSELLRSAGTVAAHVALLVLTALLSINIAYGAQRTGLRVDELRATPEPVHFLSSRADGQLLARDPWLERLPPGLRVPLPYTYVYGLAVVRAQASRPRTTWFLGEVRRGRHPAYVPLLLFAKAPLAWWALLGLLALGAARRPPQRRPLPPAARLALLFALFYVLLATRSHAQLGVRYLLPAFPFIAVAAASTLRRPTQGAAGAGAPMPMACWPGLPWALAATAPLGLLVAGGQNIGWFNLAVGGRSGGHEISIVGEDWAQDLGRLADQAEALDATPLHYQVYHRFGPLELAHQGLEVVPLDCGDAPPTREEAWVAVHLGRERWQSDRCYPWRHRIRETYEIDEHLRLYRLGPNTPTSPELERSAPP